ncbi:MAG: nuclear transport factor 2 family protein [Solirubrobacterales bacterium]
MSEQASFLENFKAGFGYGNAAFNDGDVDSAFSAIPEGIEFHPPAETGEGPFPDKRSWRDFLDRMLERHGQWRVEPREFSHPRADVVLIRTEVSGGPSLPVSGEIWQVWEFDDGVVTRIREFSDRSAALDAVEIAE